MGYFRLDGRLVRHDEGSGKAAVQWPFDRPTIYRKGGKVREGEEAMLPLPTGWSPGRANSSKRSSETGFNRHRWNVVRFKKKEQLPEDTRRYTFSLPPDTKKLGLGTCQHLQLGFHFSDRLVVRPYTPRRPVFGREEDGKFDLIVKTYAPDQSQPDGTMSNILDCLRPREEIEVKGPIGEIKYIGQGKFMIDEKEYHFLDASLVLSGSGITPGYQLISRILRAKDQGKGEDKTNINVIDANKTEGDILLKDELDRFAKDNPDQSNITHVLSHTDDKWSGEKGHVSKEIPQKHLDLRKEMWRCFAVLRL